MPRPRLQPPSPSRRGLRPSGWRVPLVVALDGSRLRWRYAPLGRAPDSSRWPTRVCHAPPDGFVERFLSLGDSRVRPERIEAFARSFGVFHHRGKPGAASGADSLANWRELAQVYSAIVAAGAELRAGHARPAAPHWQRLAAALGGDLLALPMPWGWRFTSVLKASLDRFVSPHVELQTTVESGGLVRVHLGGGSLRGALAGELLRALQGAERELVPCAACGDLHAPRGQAGRRSFCSPCRQSGAPVRLAKRDVAQRRKRALAAAAAGASLEEAAQAAYGVADPDIRQLETVDGWISSAT